MTETSYQYGIISSLPVASPATYLLLIDSRVSNYQDIINAAQPGVYHIVFDAPTRPTHSKILIKNIEDKIAELGVGAFTSIGLVQHNDEKPVYEMFGRTSDIIKPRIRAVERDDPGFQSWNSVALFITMLRQNYGIEYFDMMACALYSNPDWKYIIDKLTALTGVTVRASTDDTGAASLGGDWFLESHTGVNLKSTYFTDAIESYNGLLYTALHSSAAVPTKKLILIDHRIKDIDVIINAMNDDTYCLVFNYFYDTPASILSKLRFLNSNNRYILDHFHYETPEIPTQMDASGNQCTPCDDFDIADIQLLPGTLQNEYLEYMTSAAADDSSGNGGVWPFYSESTNITINKPVFFQRATLVKEPKDINDIAMSEDISPEENAIIQYKKRQTVSSRHNPRPMVLVSDLDEIYVLGQDVGEIVGDALAFECVGIIQHTVDPYIGYKFIGGGDDSVSPAIIQDVASRDAGLSSWAAFSGFIQSIKTAHQTTTLDMMACALYANPDWKYIIDNLAVRENITIRASLDNTGSALDEGNWVLETDNVSLTTVYFTDKIYAWKYVLATYIDTRFNALRWNNPIETNNHTGMHATRAYDSRLKIAAGTNNFTIEAWYYETAARTNSTIVDMGNYNYLFQIRTIFSVNPVGGLNFYNNELGWRHASSATITPGQWNHVAITRSGSTFTFYVNGVAQQTFTSSVSFQSNDSTFAIGMQSPDTCACNKMKLDSVLYDIRLWSVARTATEIQMNRNRVVPANSTGLVANYLCTDNGSIFDDRTANNLDATIQSYDASRWSNSTVPIPNIGFLINNNYSLRTSNTGTALNAFTHFDNITYTDFSGVDLSGVNFRGADLTGCNFTNANLTNTNLTNAYLVNATTTNAITTGSTIAQAFTNLTSTVLNLDGVDDAVDLFVPTWTYSLQFRTTMTVECWFKTADTNNQKVTAVLVSRNQTGGNSGASQFSIYMLSTGEIGFGVTNASNSGSYHTTTQTYKDTLWHHAAFTYNSSSGVKRIYIDGSLSRSDSVPGGFGLLSNNTTQKLVIGSDDGGVVNGYTDRQFRGSMSDVRIWNVERSASQIADNYQQRLAGNETGLVGYWKLNQGRGSGWGSYSAVIDSTFRPNGTIFGAGATPSGSWVLSNLNFQPRVGTMTLGANNGVYNFSDSSFLFIDPSSNSLGNFSYSVSPTSVATITNGAATTKTIYSLSAANLVPTYTLYEFPVLADLSSWKIDISFTVTGNAGTWRALIGDMYNNVNTGRGWGLWVSSSNRIHWSWVGTTAEPGTISVSLNTPYVLTAVQSSGIITFTLLNMASTYNSSLSISNLIALYNFDSTNNDSSVNNNHLTNMNTVTFNTSDYKRGTAAAAFNGSNYFQINNDGRFSPDNISITFWIKPVSTPGIYQAIASCRNSTSTTDSGWIIYIAGSNLEFWSGAGASWSNGGSLYDGFGDLNTWVHVSFTLNKSTSTLQLYINGSLFTSVSRTYINNTGTTLRIGAGRNELTAGFLLGNGTLLDDFRIYNKILSASEIGTMVAGSSYSSSFAVGSNVIGRGPVVIGNWINTGSEYFTGIISYVNVSVPTNQRLVTISSATDDGTPATVTAIQDSSFDFGWGSKTASLTVNKVAPTYQAIAQVTKTYGTDVSFSLASVMSGKSDSSGAYTFSSTSGAISITDGVATILAYTPSAITITATQAELGNYTASSTTFTLLVARATPTYQAIAQVTKTYGTDVSFSLASVMSGKSDSSGAYTFSSTSGAISITDGVATILAYTPSAITITATQAELGNYSASSTSFTLLVARATPTYQAIAEVTKTYGMDVSFSLASVMSGKSDSSGAYTFSSTSGAISITDGVATILAYTPSAITITATQAALGNYSASSTSFTLLVARATPTYQAIAEVTKTYGTDVSFSLSSVMSGKSDSSGAYTFSSTSGAISITDGVATILAYTPSAITITATQAELGNYTASSTTFTLLVNRKTPAYGEFSIPAKTYGDASFSIAPYAPTTDSSSVPFRYTSSNEDVSTINSDGTVVTIIGQGYTTITASQDASGNYAANSITTSFLVNRAAPTFLKAFTIPNKTFGDASFSLLPFTEGLDNTDGTYHFTSSNAELVSISDADGVTATIHAYTPSPITIYVAIDACGNYAASSTSGTLTVIRATPTFGTFTVPAKNFGNASFTLTAPTSNSDGAFTFTSDASNVATVTSEGTVSIVGAGSATITATQDTSGNYTSRSVTASLVISPIAPTIGALTAPAKNFADASFNLTAPTSNSDGAFTYASSNEAVATVTTGGTVSIVGAGSTTITASQAATTNYNAGSVTAVLVVSPIAPTIGTLTAPAKNFADASFNLTAPSSNSGGAFTYSSSNEAVATVTTGGTVSIVGAGSTTITATQAATTNYITGSVTAVLVVSPIAPTIGALTAPAKNFADASFNLTAPSSNSGGAFTYSSSNEAVATVTTGGTVSIVGAGSATITASQAATTNYTTGSVTAVLVVSPIAPTIGALTAPAKNFADASFNLTAPSSNSGGAFTYSSSNEAVATVTTGGTVSIVGAGSATITASQAATTNYTTGSVTAVLVVSPIAPTIGTLTAPAKNFADASFNLTAPSSNSGGAFTYASSNEAVATVTTGGTVSIVGAGSTTITATQAATTNYTTGSVTAVLVVSPIAPTIGTLTAPAKNFADASFNLTAPSSNSGGAFTYASSNEAVATVTTGGTVSIVGAGSATITATQAATTNYTTGSVTAVLVVSPIAPTIGALTAPAKNFADASFNLTAPSSNSGGAFTYSSSNEAVATVTTGGTVSIVGAGSATITASQAATTNYTTGSVTAVLVVSPIAPTIGTLTAPAKNFADASFNMTAPSSNSGGAFTYSSSNEAVATVTTGGTVSIVGAGSTTITASQAATTNYTTGSVTAVLVVSPIAPTIGALTAPAKNFADASFNLTAPSSNSGGAFTYASSNEAVATVTTGGTVSIVGAGSATITATQAATTNYTTGSVTAVLVVSPIAPTIGALTAPAKNFADASFNLTAPSSNSGGAFTYASSNEAVATVTTGGTVSIVGAGSATITATQAATTNYTTGSVTAVLVVSPIAPTYQAIAQLTKTYGIDVSFSLSSVMSGKSDSSGAYTFSSTSGAIDICGGVATILAYTPSAITITATQAALGNYTASSTSFTLLVNRKTPVYGDFSVPAKTYGDASFSIAPYAPTTDSSSVPFTYTSSNQAVATINSDGTVVTIIGQGYTTITASQDASGNYAANSITTSFLVNRAAPTFLKAFTIPTKTFGDASFSLLPFTEGLDNTDGTYHFTSSNAQLVSISGVDGVTATIHAYTPTPITIYVAIDACGNYAASSTSGTLTVIRATPTFGTFTVPAKNFGNASFTLTAPTSNSDGAFTFTSDASNVATVTSEGTVSIVGAGSATITATQDTSGSYTSRSVTASLVVSPIAPTIGTLTAPAKNFADASFNLTAPSSNSGGAFTYASSNEAVATVTTGGTVSIVGAGSTTITASQAATTNYTTGSVTAVLVVSPIAPTIGTLTAPAKNFADASFNLTAPSSNSGGAFTYASSNEAVATVTTGGTVSIVGAGSATITATQAATTNYTTGSVTAVLVVSPIAPTIGALTAPAKNFADASFNLTAPSSNSGGAFTYASSNEAVATVSSGGRVTIVGAGSTTITASQAATTNYNAGSVTAVLVVSPIAPTIGTLTAPAKNFADASFNLTAPSSNSGGAFTYASSNESVATVTTGGTVSIVGAGSTTITATQAATTNYITGSVTAVLVVSPIAPTIGAFTIPQKNINDGSFNVSPPSSNSTGAFTYTSDASNVATITSSGVVSLVGVGTATITATQAASTNYTSGSVSALLEVNAILSNFVIAPKRYTDDPFDLTNPNSLYSNEPFTFSIVGDTTIASIGGAAGRTVTILKAGETQIRATQAATAEHAEVSITARLVVSKLTPVITLASITKTYGDASFNLAPSSTNTDNAASVFSFSSSNTSIVSIFDTSYVSITGVGSATITMTQPATTNFTDASGTLTITIIKATPVLSALTVSSNKTYGTLPFSALALPTSLSNGAIAYSSSDNNVATIDNSGVITLVASGFVTFTATQAATALYNGATKASNTMTVHRKILLLERSSPTNATINKTYGDSYFTVSATNASNGGAITYETDNPSVAGVINASTGVISVVSVGTATITARRGQTAQYTSEPVSWTVEVARLATTLSGLADLSYNVTAAPFTVSASSISDGTVTYSLQDPTSTVLTIDSSSGLVTLRSAGSAVIVASQAPGTLYQTPAPITATITVTPAGNTLQGATITDTSSFASVNLSGASLEGVTITNTTFADATLSNVNMTNAVITGANFTGADLSGATLSGATITSATFTDVSLKSADLSGAIMTSTVFTGSDLSGANLTRVDASGSSFVNANLNNVDLTGANIANVNFTNTSIKNAVITDISFSPLQKIQLLKNSENRDIEQIIIPEVSGPTILAAISTTSPLRAIPNLDMSSASVIVSVVVPTSSPTPAVVLQNIVLNVTDYDKFYLPINQGEFFQINDVKYFTSEGLVWNYATNSVVDVITYEGKSVWLLAGSVVGLVLQTNTLSASSFVVPSHILYTNTTPFMPTTPPTSNSNAPIVYSSSNPSVATIDASSGLITPTGIIGDVIFTATQVQNATYGPGTITSNRMVADKAVNFALIGLNQTFNLSTLAELDANAIIPDTTDATAVFYVRLSDMLNVFKYQTDSADVNDIDISDIKYYVFHRKWPTELKINPSHAMMDQADSRGKLGENFTSDRSLLKHDFIRYLALRLFNTVHGVDLFRNESDLRENMTYFGENVRYNIDSILSGISTTSSSVSMSYDASANKYLTNDSSGNTNLCRELMRQVAAYAPSRFYNNGGNTDNLRNVPFVENDTITFKVIVESAADQNVLTGVSSIPSRSYTIKLILSNTVTSDTNTVVSDSEMYPNAYPYSSSVMTYAPTTDSSGVYNIYSPPAPIPFSRFGYNGWYYTNSSAWVNVAPGVRNHIKWLVSANTVSSTVADLRFVRLNLKIHNNASLPYLMIYTQAGSTRKYAVIGGNGSLTNGTLYSMYINFGSYLDEPAMIGYTNAELVNTIGTGSFASNEIITSIAIETESNAAAGNVEFTLASIIVGELSPSSGLMGEKEYGFEAEVPSSYP